MERAIIYCAKTGLEATDHFVPELLEKYCKDNGYEIVAMLSEPASTEGVSFPMKYAFIGLNMEEDVNTIITLSKDMIGATDETVIDTLGKLSEYDIYVEDINGELEECYEMMYKEPVQESDIRVSENKEIEIVFDFDDCYKQLLESVEKLGYQVDKEPGGQLNISRRVKGDILLCYSSRIEENSPCKSNRVEIAKVEDAIMKTVNMYATVYLDEKGIKRAGKSKEVSPEEKLAVLEKKVKSLSSKKMMLYSDYKDDKLTREEYVKRSKAMVEQIDELHQKIEQLKSELPTEDNSAGKFETQLENIINMESFDREKIQKVIKKVIINGEDNIEIVWNTDDPFFK